MSDELVGVGEFNLRFPRFRSSADVAVLKTSPSELGVALLKGDGPPLVDLDDRSVTVTMLNAPARFRKGDYRGDLCGVAI